MAFTNRCRFLYPLVKTLPILLPGFGFTVSAAEQYQSDRSQNQSSPQQEFPESVFADTAGFVEITRYTKPQPKPKGVAVPILQISQSQIKIDTFAINKVLDKVGNRPFAIYSVNGPARTGKSFLLNYFIRYLRSPTNQSSSEWMNTASPSSSSDSAEQIKSEASELFQWRGESSRCTTGINLWSEPFEITNSKGDKIPILLLDCQGSFDDQTSMNQNAIIFAISTLLSSVLIFNIMKQIDENAMQFLDLFAAYAATITSTLEKRTIMHAGHGSSTGFQKLIILIRDFDFSDYLHGYYSNTECPSGSSKNFKRDKIDPQPTHQPPEIQEARFNIISKFDEVGVFLMPDPGRELRRGNRTDALEPDFRQHLQGFVELTLSPEKLTTKKLYGEELTGNKFKDYISSWAELDWTKKVPELEDIKKCNQEVQYQHTKREAIDKYKSGMRLKLELNAYRLSGERLLELHEKARAESEDFYLRAAKLGGSTLDDRFRKEFKLESDELFTDFMLINKGKDEEPNWIVKILKPIIEPIITILGIKKLIEYWRT